jgi:hypothetical protein
VVVFEGNDNGDRSDGSAYTNRSTDNGAIAYTDAA